MWFISYSIKKREWIGLSIYLWILSMGEVTSSGALFRIQRSLSHGGLSLFNVVELSHGHDKLTREILLVSVCA